METLITSQTLGKVGIGNKSAKRMSIDEIKDIFRQFIEQSTKEELEMALSAIVLNMGMEFPDGIGLKYKQITIKV